MDYAIAYCIPATRNKAQNTALIFMTSVILWQKLRYFSQVDQFTRESPFNCVNFKTDLPIKSYVPTDNSPFLPFFAPPAGCPVPWFPVCTHFSSFLSVHSMRPAGKHVSQCSASFSFVFLSLSKASPPLTGQFKSSAPAGIPVDAELICFDYVQMLNCLIPAL